MPLVERLTDSLVANLADRLSKEDLVTRRRKSQNLLRPFRYRKEGEGNLDVMEGFLQEKIGIVVVFNHFSKGDVPVVARYCANNDVIAKAPKVLVPIARHQYNFFARLYETGFALQLVPIVTPDTVRRGKAEKKEQGQEIFSYLRTTIKTLQEGGIVFLAAGAARQPELEGEPSKVMRLLQAASRGSDFSNFALQFVGLGLRNMLGHEIRDYHGRDGYNAIIYSYSINPGPCVLWKDALAQALAAGQDIDRWVLNRLKPLVPDAYRGKDQEFRPSIPGVNP
jgi:hypothetical protein